MAQKKISDLQLRSDFDETCSVPVDDGTQTWRATGAQILDFVRDDIITEDLIQDLTADTAPQSVDSVMVRDDSAVGLKEVTLFDFKKKRTNTQTSAYTATAEDDVIFVTAAAAWTLALPTAVGIAGKEYRILRTTTSVANAVTVDGNASETIGGATTFALTTAGEMLHIVSDGTNWQILEHRASIGPYSESLTISAGFGTTSLQSTWFTRRGKMLYCHGYFKAGTTAATEANIQLPSGYLIDTAALTSTASVQIVGRYRAIRNNGTPGAGFKEELFYDGSTNNKLYFAGVNSNSNILGKSNGNDNFNSSDGCAFHFEIPIAAWPA